ncbi:MAG: alkaline phosphatase [Kosmotogales bacterium]|nr:alkaline phosphatase [Kosmotogales bacterium]
MKKGLFILAVLLVVSTVIFAAAPKYVFYFIGDGLGASQRQIAEYYYRHITDDDDAKLVMNQFPVAGINTTYSADTLVTDSAAAGTALATGYKTNNGMISVLPNGAELKTLLQAAQDKGMSTGLVTTTRVTHATPAVFGAHNPDRNDENGIADDYLANAIDFIAGGGVRHFIPQDFPKDSVDPTGSTIKSKRIDDVNLLEDFADAGYDVFWGSKGAEDFMNTDFTAEDKVLALFTYSHIPYEIDRINDGMILPSLAEMTSAAVDALSSNENGFFLMVEGGRIDHACHANDIAGTIWDTLAFDEAVKVGYDFLQDHADETLILVCGDHETGGMGLGFATNYFLDMEPIDLVKTSIEDQTQYVYETGKRDEFFEFIADQFGLTNLDDREYYEISRAMEAVDTKGAAANIFVGVEYGSYDPVAIAVAHVVSERANLMWTTYAHTGTAIPLSAVGINSGLFGGYKDNTEVGQAMAQAGGFEL